MKRVYSRASGQVAGVLSRPKRRVLELLAEGYQQKQIARALGLQLRTVEDHTRALKEHFGMQGAKRVDWQAFMADRLRRGEG